ncbi:Beta-mannosidase [Chionoecetes opilio]|uniref:Beta-mannosidase n=1 Tax=Chionoecetes opilio TaxID=41210 RepID=A0A8J5CWI1_CHIOP|nr:Beta-mannosidase [Chionoecetes opilio]
MTPNPLTRELEARREGAWWRVYALPLVCLVLMSGATAYLAYAAFVSTHPRPHSIIIIPSNWSLHIANKSISVGGQVPGGVYTDLLAANVLNAGDFYYRYNDMDYRWVSKENWTYSTVMQVGGGVLNHSRVALVFEGLDTAAEVFLNDQEVGKANNMFTRYIFDVKNHLQVVFTGSGNVD